MFDHTFVAFTFKEKVVPQGQYKFPFAFRLPFNMPGSYRFKSKSTDLISIKYSVECYFDAMKGIMHDKCEFIVREFLFTEEEMEEDWRKCEKFMKLRSLLKPMTARIVSDEFIQKKKKEHRQSVPTNKNTLALNNEKWSLEQEITGSRCLCFTSHYTIRINAFLNKQMFYPDEKVIIKIQIDNSTSSCDIKQIDCNLTHTLKVKNANDCLHKESINLKFIHFEGVKKKAK